MREFLDSVRICYLSRRFCFMGWLVGFWFDSLFRFAVLKYTFYSRKFVSLTIRLDICAFCYRSRGWRDFADQNDEREREREGAEESQK